MYPFTGDGNLQFSIQMWAISWTKLKIINCPTTQTFCRLTWQNAFRFVIPSTIQNSIRCKPWSGRIVVVNLCVYLEIFYGDNTHQSIIMIANKCLYMLKLRWIQMWLPAAAISWHNLNHSMNDMLFLNGSHTQHNAQTSYTPSIDVNKFHVMSNVSRLAIDRYRHGDRILITILSNHPINTTFCCVADV